MPNANTINIFFSLLRAGIYGVPVPESELPESIDWKAVVTLAKKHVVYGIIIDSVQFVPERLRPSQAVYAKMNKFAMGLLKTNAVLDLAVAHLATSLKQRGIDGVLLKGQGLARYYRVPEMRQCGDIDFYVGKKNYKEAIRICQEDLSDDNSETHEIEPHFNFMMNGIPIELHRLASKIHSPYRGKQFQRWIEEQLEQSPSRRIESIGNADITLPSYDFDAIFIFYHAWRHLIMSGLGMRQLCDWIMVLHNHDRDIDTERLKKNIHRFGMTRGWKVFACIAVDHLGLPEDEMPLYDPTYRKKSEKILKEIINGGNFGFYSKNHLGASHERFSLTIGLSKLRKITNHYLSLLPLISVETTLMFFSSLYSGSQSTAKKLKHTLKGCIKRK
jgi:hypothetical protein